MKIKPLAALALAGLLLGGCGLKPEAEELPASVITPVVTQREVIEVKRGPIEARQALNVSIGAGRQSSLYVRTSGRLRHLHTTVGKHVEEGQLLLELEPGSLPYDLAQAEIDLEKVRNTLKTAQGKAGFVDAPKPEDLERYALDVKSSELKLQRLQTSLADTRLYAPFAGTVITLTVAEGDNVDAYKEIIVLAGDGLPTARASVDDATAALLRPGQVADIFPSDGNPTPVKGKVTSVAIVGSGGTTRQVLIQPDAASPRLVVGRNGKVEIVLESKPDVLLVPLSAIRTYGGRTLVTVVTGTTRQEVAIKIGITSDAYAEVLSGLQAGDKVVGR